MMDSVQRPSDSECYIDSFSKLVASGEFLAQFVSYIRSL
jgi:hypothetical protein